MIWVCLFPWSIFYKYSLKVIFFGVIYTNIPVPFEFCVIQFNAVYLLTSETETKLPVQAARSKEAQETQKCRTATIMHQRVWAYIIFPLRAALPFLPCNIVQLQNCSGFHMRNMLTFFYPTLHVGGWSIGKWAAGGSRLVALVARCWWDVALFQ